MKYTSQRQQVSCLYELDPLDGNYVTNMQDAIIYLKNVDAHLPRSHVDIFNLCSLNGITPLLIDQRVYIMQIELTLDEYFCAEVSKVFE